MGVMKKFKIYTKHGIFQFVGRLKRETITWQWYDTHDRCSFQVKIDDILMITENQLTGTFSVETDSEVIQ